jgi:hypothetical protein
MLYRLSYASRWKQAPEGTILPWPFLKVRDNYLSYHKGNSPATQPISAKSLLKTAHAFPFDGRMSLSPMTGFQVLS